MTYALDTNTISYLIKGIGEVEKHFEREIIQAGGAYVIPPVTVFEIRRWLNDNPTPNLLAFAKVFDDLYESVKSRADMTSDSWEKAAEIYIALKHKGEIIDEADIFIAAYCTVNGYTLVTNNIRHFERIPGLKYVDWK